VVASPAVTAPRLAFLLAALALAATARAEAPAPAEPAHGPEVVSLRFAWPAPLDAAVTYRHTRIRSGAPRSTFVARYRSRAEPEPGGDGLRILTSGTTWEGDLPFPPAVARNAIRASERVVMRVSEDGEFAGLDGAGAMRPVLERLFENAKVPPAQSERAVALAEAAMRSEAEETWNLAVGFWTGADLELGEAYVTRSEGELPFAPGVPASSAVEFTVRRKVPCAAGERAARCVEVTLRSTPDRAAIERAAKALLGRLAGADRELPERAREGLAVESELLLVTEPATLRPYRLVWTRSLRAGPGDSELPALEQVERQEYDYRYPAPPRRPAHRRPKVGPPSAAR
jgi:hypothetical protein